MTGAFAIPFSFQPMGPVYVGRSSGESLHLEVDSLVFFTVAFLALSSCRILHGGHLMAVATWNLVSCCKVTGSSALNVGQLDLGSYSCCFRAIHDLHKSLFEWELVMGFGWEGKTRLVCDCHMV